MLGVLTTIVGPAGAVAPTREPYGPGADVGCIHV
jgi:hypothetical protein